jgi:hypothetical protein
VTKAEEYEFYLATLAWEEPDLKNIGPIVAYLRSGRPISPWAAQYLADMIENLLAQTQPAPAHRPKGSTTMNSDPHHLAARLAGANLQHWREGSKRDRVPTVERDRIILDACREVQTWPAAGGKQVEPDMVRKILGWPRSRRLPWPRPRHR